MVKKEVIENYIKNGIAFKDAANECGVSRSTFSRWAHSYGLKSPIGHCGARKKTFNENFFESIDSEEKAYWLGFIAADGCVYLDNNRLRLQINLKGSDVDHLVKFQNAIGSKYKIAEKLIKTSPVCQLKINSNVMCNDLSMYNVVPRKSIVYCPVKIDKSLEHHFVRGFFDGDGWIKDCERKGSKSFRVNAGIVGGSCCLEFFKSVLPDGFSIYKLKCSSTVMSLESSSRNVIINTYNYLYKDATIYLTRKKDRFENIMSRLIEI